MKIPFGYLITTGALFGLMAVVHVARAIAEWPPHPDGAFLGTMALLIIIPGLLSAWAWWTIARLRRSAK